MAIVLAVPGLEVTVEVDNVPLPEYQYADEETDQDEEEDALGAEHREPADSVTKYIEVTSGAEFSVRMLFKVPLDATMPAHADIYIDNNYIQAPLRETGDVVNLRGYKYAMAMSNEDGQMVTQRFRFSKLSIGKSWIDMRRSSSKLTHCR